MGMDEPWLIPALYMLFRITYALACVFYLNRERRRNQLADRAATRPVVVLFKIAASSWFAVALMRRL